VFLQVEVLVNGVMKALSSAQQSEVKAWEEEILACEHTLTLQQEPVIVPGDGESLSELSLCLRLTPP
jgi:ubiquitin carboxyl-terminal hydrolase 5/13